jgi:Tfp pilus assembly protein PilX
MQKIALAIHNNNGSTLVVGLLTLVLLSLIGVAATTTSRTEVGIAGNDKTATEAFYATELGLTTGETVVESLASRVDLNEDTTPGRYGRDTEPDWYKLLWNNTDSVQVPTAAIPDGLQRMAAPPRYTIEERDFRRDSLTVGIGVPTGVYLFNVSACGTGGDPKRRDPSRPLEDCNGASQTVLLSIYAKRYN